MSHYCVYNVNVESYACEHIATFTNRILCCLCVCICSTCVIRYSMVTHFGFSWTCRVNTEHLRGTEALIPARLYHLLYQITYLECSKWDFRLVGSCLSNRLWFAPCAFIHNGTFFFLRSVSSWFFSTVQTDKNRTDKPQHLFYWN